MAFLDLAVCVGADYRLFDAINGSLALDALSYCDRCPVTVECEKHVSPRRSYFDGVCAGKVWREGRIIRREMIEGD